MQLTFTDSAQDTNAAMAPPTLLRTFMFLLDDLSCPAQASLEKLF